VGHCDFAFFGRVRELVVRPDRIGQHPTVCLELFDDCCAVHDV
jgi:hypothetical protein